MLDLDSLAEERARILNEGEEVWRKAVWSPVFQACAQNMTDGEVEMLLSSCPSAAHLEAVLSRLDDQEKQEKPLSTLQDLAAGRSLAEWIRGLS